MRVCVLEKLQKLLRRVYMQMDGAVKPGGPSLLRRLWFICIPHLLIARARARAPVLHHHSWKKESHLAKFKFFLLLNNVVLGLGLLPTGKLDVHARTAALRFDADEDTPPCSLLI